VLVYLPIDACTFWSKRKEGVIAYIACRCVFACVHVNRALMLANAHVHGVFSYACTCMLNLHVAARTCAFCVYVYMCMCGCVCICVCLTCTHTHNHAYIVHIHAQAQNHILWGIAYTHICMHISTCQHIHTKDLGVTMHTCMYAYIYTSICQTYSPGISG
jgi:hypothetical protein